MKNMMMNINLKQERYDVEALNNVQGLDFAYTFLIERIHIHL